jgi:hypothetical protein
VNSSDRRTRIFQLAAQFSQDDSIYILQCSNVFYPMNKYMTTMSPMDMSSISFGEAKMATPQIVASL